MRDFIENKTVTIRSVRLLEELRVFIWKNGKQQAMQGYNDDLVMSFAIGMYLRETSLRFKKTAENLTIASLDAMNKTGAEQAMYNHADAYRNNPWKLDIGTANGMESMDLTWLI
jgi:hypothetical protein